MKVPFLDLRTQYLEIKAEVDEAVLKALDSGWYILGKRCEGFEASFKEYLAGNEEGFVIGVNSGTDALKLSLLAEGVGQGDEVITVANTAIPTAAAICSTGASPVFCDVDSYKWLIDPSKIEPLITNKTRAIIPVHLYGSSCDMGPIMDIARRHGLAVIEDVAQATGAVYRGNKCGTVGDYGAFSFYPSKNLGAFGDGGAIFVRDVRLRDRLMMLRNYGQSGRYNAELERGENSRLDELQAAILSVKLTHLDVWNSKRRRLASYYRERLDGLKVLTQSEYPDVTSVNHLLVIKVEADKRGSLMGGLNDKGVQTLVHYPIPLYNQPAFSGCKRESNPVSEMLCSSVISLPFHQYLDEAEIDYVVNVLADELARA